MRELLARLLDDGRRAVIAHSTRADGDLSPSTVDAATLTERRRAAVGAGPWHAVHQVHGDRVVHVAGDPTADTDVAGPRTKADALVTEASNQVLAVHSGDCVPVGFIHPAGAVAVAHAGWKGLEAGVLAATVSTLQAAHGDATITAAIGPHVHAASYEFGREDLERLAARFGEDIIAETTSGTPALDLTVATTSALRSLDVGIAITSPDCTATLADDYWSYRARSEAGRIALVGWLEPV
jgi:YfiH family protein